MAGNKLFITGKEPHTTVVELCVYPNGERILAYGLTHTISSGERYTPSPDTVAVLVDVDRGKADSCTGTFDEESLFDLYCDRQQLFGPDTKLFAIGRTLSPSQAAALDPLRSELISFDPTLYRMTCAVKGPTPLSSVNTGDDVLGYAYHERLDSLLSLDICDGLLYYDGRVLKTPERLRNMETNIRFAREQARERRARTI